MIHKVVGVEPLVVGVNPGSDVCQMGAHCRARERIRERHSTRVTRHPEQRVPGKESAGVPRARSVDCARSDGVRALEGEGGEYKNGARELPPGVLHPRDVQVLVRTRLGGTVVGNLLVIEEVRGVLDVVGHLQGRP